MTFHGEEEIEIKKRQERVKFLNKVRVMLPAHDSEDIVTAHDIADELNITCNDALDALAQLRKMKLIESDSYKSNRTKGWWKAAGKF